MDALDARIDQINSAPTALSMGFSKDKSLVKGIQRDIKEIQGRFYVSETTERAPRTPTEAKFLERVKRSKDGPEH